MEDNSDGMSLKEVLLDVSRKLDRFLEAHAILHTEMAQRETTVAQELAAQREMKNEVQSLRDWKNEVQGQMKLLKWASAGGLASAAALVLKLLGVPLP